MEFKRINRTELYMVSSLSEQGAKAGFFWLYFDTPKEITAQFKFILEEAFRTRFDGDTYQLEATYELVKPPRSSRHTITIRIGLHPRTPPSEPAKFYYGVIYEESQCRKDVKRGEFSLRAPIRASFLSFIYCRLLKDRQIRKMAPADQEREMAALSRPGPKKEPLVQHLNAPSRHKNMYYQLTNILIVTEAMFRCRRTLEDRAYEAIFIVEKKVLKWCVAEPETRKFLGSQRGVWLDFTNLFTQAVPELERQSFAPLEAASDGGEVSHSALMVSNHATLLKDLERLTDILRIGRVIVPNSLNAQNLAAEAAFDQQILKYIELCLRVTTRGYDGGTNQRMEALWTTIIAAWKKLLATCIQFLHNMVNHNEHRKLLLWLDLFGGSRASDPYFAAKFSKVYTSEDHNANPDPTSETEDPHTGFVATKAPASKIGELTEDSKSLKAAPDNGKGPSVAAETKTDAEQLFKDVASQLGTDLENLGIAANSSRRVPPTEHNARAQVSRMPSNTSAEDPDAQKWDWRELPPNFVNGGQGEGQDEIRDEDTMILKTPEAAARTLNDAKKQLMDRLRHMTPNVLPPSNISWRPKESNLPDEGLYHSTQGSDMAADGSAEDEEDEEDVESYTGIGDQQRGLLTDIPLVLGLREIEALPMIIKIGICNLPGNLINTTVSESKHMQAVRCNILLAQDAGRNLLRELLIFIAAWDCHDNDMYFKHMSQIMEAILENGLMPFAYQTFGEVKDIVSPAQAIVIKMLTQLFRKKYCQPPAVAGGPLPPRRETPNRVDLLVVRYIFTVFRQSIIPETCALIYLQGQIRLGVALKEDFPLNLWDMERVYEGVYQFLELFAVLTESENWKDLLVKWEIVSELVTLLRELDASIPKAPLSAASQATTEAQAGLGDGTDNGEGSSRLGPTLAPALVERPYDPVPAEETGPAGYNDTEAIESPGQDDLDDPHPAEFEWRNLKKLVVLVLSSLVWKSADVQSQIRKYGGVEMVLSCCNYDAHNPYIREHAIMCLRFLLENCPENQKIVEQLEARKVVPDEVLDKQGYETFIDTEGKVGLRRKEPPAEAPQTFF